MHHCSDHLSKEIRIIRPKAVLAFGKEALESVRDILSPSSEIDGLKTLFSEKRVFEWSGIRVFPLVHPNGYWKSPAMTKNNYLDILRWYVSQIESQ